MSDRSQLPVQNGDSSKVLLGVAAYAEAQGLRSRLAKEGIEVAIIHNQATCTSGCALKVEVWAHPDDVADIGRLLADDRARTLAEMNYDPGLLEHVYDPGAEMAVCPACATEFPTSSASCPDCGLCFGGPEPKSGGNCGPKGCK